MSLGLCLHISLDTAGATKGLAALPSNDWAWGPVTGLGAPTWAPVVVVAVDFNWVWLSAEVANPLNEKLLIWLCAGPLVLVSVLSVPDCRALRRGVGNGRPRSCVLAGGIRPRPLAGRVVLVVVVQVVVVAVCCWPPLVTNSAFGLLGIGLA